MHSDDADDHEDRAERVPDQGTPVDRSALWGQDVQDRLADQESPADDRDRGQARQNAGQENRARDQDLQQLQKRVRRHLAGHYARAWAKSATMSSAASMPTDTRTVPGPTPSSARSAGVSPRCDVISGYETVVSTPPRLAAKVTIRKRDSMRCTAARPPSRSNASIPPVPSGISRSAN